MSWQIILEMSGKIERADEKVISVKKFAGSRRLPSATYDCMYDCNGYSDSEDSDCSMQKELDLAIQQELDKYMNAVDEIYNRFICYKNKKRD